ncbi:hypothetical protein A8C32_04605 [Flavivirga aquatica]|uniref:Uncharacterized protein n=1 Tax=Flavivirga aquatica TaxID=1849968 RepID=A0A1E5SHA8_9FLAO|nr:hypothetical protein [Flavivirga aquatica]OEJ98499.1 hypothetical protein A8C32_04605 [Flavivirga aquatica]
MKKSILIIVLFLSFKFINAQQSFTKTENFLITTEIKDKTKLHAPFVVNLVHAEDQSKKISTFKIEDTELFEDIFVTTLKNPGLVGVSEVIKMEIEYLGCCAHVEAYYYMVKDDNTIVPLPRIKNVYCENSDRDFQYIFPNQEFGVKGNILETQTFYKEMLKDVKYVNSMKSFVWNGGIVLDSNITAIASN